MIFILISCSLLLPFHGRAQPDEYAFEQLDSLQQVAPRPVVVFIHTDWCKYCAAMKSTTLRDPSVVKLLNQSYYFVALDAEEKEDIRWRGHAFSFQPSGNRQGIHALAEQLGTVNGAVSYPTLCFLNADYEIVFQYNQFIGASDLVEALASLQTNR
jgi:thioredoxin-related protein